MRISALRICRSRRRRRIFTAVIDPATTCSPTRIVAVDLKTGQRKWHYQLVHHSLWNLDIAAAPILADITVNGRPVKAVLAMTKAAMMYVLDRATGQPVWPIEERPAPKGDVPGEVVSPTQPYPTKPPAYDLQGVTESALIDFTPELRAAGDRERGEVQTRPDLHAAGGQQT